MNRLRSNAAARTIPIALWTYVRFSTVGFIFLSLAWSQTLKQTLPSFDPAIRTPLFQSHWLFKLEYHARLTRHSLLRYWWSRSQGICHKDNQLTCYIRNRTPVLLFHQSVPPAKFAGPRSLRDRHRYTAPTGLLYLNPLDLAIVHIMNFSVERHDKF